MSLLAGWLPPTRENWELAVYAWQFFPLVTAVQWLTDFFPQGKTSIPSRFNLPGKWAWCLMELPGALTAAYCMLRIPPTLGLSALDLPAGNWTLLGLYCAHYAYRAVLAPLLLNPSMSPIHPLVFASAAAWQVVNGLGIGGFVAGYGPTSVHDWAGRPGECVAGLVVFGWALLGNIFHDDELREIRREVGRQQRARAEQDGKPVSGVDKVYLVPKGGLFRFVLFPHYLCEWVEWLGFWILAGRGCVPARSFLLNEIATMLPRSLAGWRWYVRTFGRDKIGDRKAIIPFLL